MKIKPLGDRVLVRPNKPEEQTKGGIIIPDTAQKKSDEAEVIMVGSGKRDEHGKRIPFEVSIGDKILMPKYGGTEIKIDGVPHQMITESDILGIIE